MEPVRAVDLAPIKPGPWQGKLSETDVLVRDGAMQDALATLWRCR
jgi:hypothetical protein